MQRELADLYRGSSFQEAIANDRTLTKPRSVFTARAGVLPLSEALDVSAEETLHLLGYLAHCAPAAAICAETSSGWTFARLEQNEQLNGLTSSLRTKAEQAKQNGQPLSFLLIQNRGAYTSYFKKTGTNINYSNFLRRVFNDAARAQDVLFRPSSHWQNSNFCVVLPAADLPVAMQQATRLVEVANETLKRECPEAAKEDLNLSVAVSTTPEGRDWDLDGLLRVPEKSTSQLRHSAKKTGVTLSCNPLIIWRARQDSNPRPLGS